MLCPYLSPPFRCVRLRLDCIPQNRGLGGRRSARVQKAARAAMEAATTNSGMTSSSSPPHSSPEHQSDIASNSEASWPAVAGGGGDCDDGPAAAVPVSLPFSSAPLLPTTSYPGRSISTSSICSSNSSSSSSHFPPVLTAPSQQWMDDPSYLRIQEAARTLYMSFSLARSEGRAANPNRALHLL